MSLPENYHRTRTIVPHGTDREVTLYIGPDPERAPRNGFWIVTEDVLSRSYGEESGREGTCGPGSIEPSADVPTEHDAMRADPRAVKWRTYSDDGLEEGVTYRGLWIEGTDDLEEGTDPLTAFAGPDSGDVTLDVLVDGRWVGYLG